MTPEGSTALAGLSLDLYSLGTAYSEGLTPTALMAEVWRRCEALGDPAVWIHRLPRDELLAHARRVESEGPEGRPLYGIPFAIKDNIDLSGVPTTAGCPAFSFVPGESAVVVQRLLRAGAIPVGKTNLDQFATGLVGVRSPFGVPRNPFNPEVVPGGSSSGSAVSVATGLVAFALGTDTAGSGRVPAGLNNLVGLKPTRGALSTRGVVPACRSLDCVSIFALTCADARAIASVASAYDADDPYSRRRPALAADSSRGLIGRIGVPRSEHLAFFGDAEAGRLFGEALGRARDLGADLIEIDYGPFAEAAALLYQGPWVAERWADLRAFFKSHGADVHPVTRRIIEGASGLCAADVFDGFHQLAAVARRVEAEWERMDALLLPTAPRPYTRAEVESEPILLNSRLGTYTNFVNLLDLSALAVPAGVRSDAIPWGVTLVGRAWAEMELLEWGSRWQQSVGGRLGATSQTLADLPAMAARSPGFEVQSTMVRLAVVGAHLSGLPLNGQLVGCGARLVWSGRSAPLYRLFVLPGTVPPKPGMVRVGPGGGVGVQGASVALEVWEMPTIAFGGFVAAIPPPLGIGTVVLENGEMVKGFLCESIATAGAEDITELGGWRAYLQAVN